MTRGMRKGEWYELPLGRERFGDALPDFASASRLVPVPRKWWDKLVRQGGVRTQGNRLLLHAFAPEPAGIAPEWGELPIVYEDDFCLVADKPAGMPVHPNEAGQTGTLAALVAAHYETTGQACRVRHIHRLDADTSGLVLFAKNEWAHLLLDERMREKAIRRSYLALAQGRFARRSGTIDAPIGRDRHHATRRRVSPGGDPAVTHYAVALQANHAALVELMLETGRTHQIRVHLSHLGHPLIGDALYGGNASLFPRQALHGYKLSFAHPITGETVEVESELPADMALLLGRLREGAKI